MESYLCIYHNYDGPFKGPVNKNPEITCQACRAGGYFTHAQIEEYERKYYRLVAVFRRRLGYPEKVHVIMDDGDSEEEARRIGPRGRFILDSLDRRDPYVAYDNNTIVLKKPEGDQTLEDTRKDWDHAPPQCY